VGVREGKIGGSWESDRGEGGREDNRVIGDGEGENGGARLEGTEAN